MGLRAHLSLLNMIHKMVPFIWPPRTLQPQVGWKPVLTEVHVNKFKCTSYHIDIFLKRLQYGQWRTKEHNIFFKLLFWKNFIVMLQVIVYCPFKLLVSMNLFCTISMVIYTLHGTSSLLIIAKVYIEIKRKWLIWDFRCYLLHQRYGCVCVSMQYLDHCSMARFFKLSE